MYDNGAWYSKYFVAQLMLSRFDVTVAKKLLMQQVAHQKATASYVSAASIFQFFLLGPREDSHLNYSLLL